MRSTAGSQCCSGKKYSNENFVVALVVGYDKTIGQAEVAQSDSVPAGAGEYKHQITALKKKGINMDTAQLKRIADAMEEILRLVKKDMEPRTKKKEK